MDHIFSIIDSHIHLDQYSDDELPEFIRRMREASCTHAIAVGSDLITSKRTLALANCYKGIVPAAGFHPEQPLPSNREVEELCTWIRQNASSIAAIGEIGLPTYLLREQPDLDMTGYIALLEQLLDLAGQLGKPVNLHAVYEEADIVFDLLRNSSIRKAHFHWFKGSRKTMNRMIDRGYHISISPEVTYREKIQEICRYYPLDLMMMETDGPWPFSGPFLNERTHPEMIHRSIRSVSVIKQMELRKVYETLYENTVYFYDLE